MRKLACTRIYTSAGAPLDDHVLVLNEDGKILEISPVTEHDNASIEWVDGVLVPGFINAHCHLELSHMKGKVDTGTGLIPFITNVVQHRGADEEEIQQAIADAEQEMIKGGIVAVGDISNVVDTFPLKHQGNLRYYTFVEMFDFLNDAEASTYFDRYLTVYDALVETGGSRKSVVPHAPYTVSETLFEQITRHNRGTSATISIHNQEMPHENALFVDKSGDLIEFYERFGFSLDNFEPIGRNSIWFAIANLDPEQRTIFVHNTMTTSEEVAMAKNWSPNTFWCTCPNANLYIENRLPDYAAFLENRALVCIGTDSLCSNWQLSILEEMKTIEKYQSYVPFEDLLRWATINGARALGFDDMLGSIETGKTPGIVRLSVDPAVHGLAKATAERLA